MSKPLVIDLFCGLGGWSAGFLAEGWDCIGFDIERHVYGADRYPAQLVLQDVLTLDGAQFRGADAIVASPPCQAYSYRAMPWKRAKALPPPSNELFDACFRIQREACAAAGRYIPLVVENVKGAQPWVGKAKWHYGSFYLWGNVPALMPTSAKRAGVKQHGSCAAWLDTALDERRRGAVAVKVPGLKPGCFPPGGLAGHFATRTSARKAASAQIAKIPFELSLWIARCFRPEAH